MLTSQDHRIFLALGQRYRGGVRGFYRQPHFDDAEQMGLREDFRARFGRRLTDTASGRAAAASAGLSPDEALRAGL